MPIKRVVVKTAPLFATPRDGPWIVIPGLSRPPRRAQRKLTRGLSLGGLLGPPQDSRKAIFRIRAKIKQLRFAV